MKLAPLVITSTLFLASALLLATPLAMFAPAPVLAVAALAVMWRQPTIGVIGLAALVPLEGAFPGQPLLSGAKFFGAATLLIVAAQLVIRKLDASQLRTNLTIPLVTFLAIYLVSAIAGIDHAVSVEHFRQLVVGLVILAVTLAVRDRLDLDWLARGIVLATGASCTLSLAPSGRSVVGRGVGLLEDPNYFALLTAFALPLGVMLVIGARSAPARLLWLGSSGLIVAGMITSESRSGFIVMTATLLAMLWHYREVFLRLRARHLGGLALVAAIALPLVAVLIPASYVERIQSLTNVNAGVRSYGDTAIGRRMSYILVAFEAWKDDPLIGSGPGTYAGHYGRSKYAPAFSQSPSAPDLFRRAHNTYLELLVETGTLGASIFIALVAITLRNFWLARSIALRHGRSEAIRRSTHFGLAFVAVTLFMAFLSIPNHKYLWLMLAVSTISLARARDLEQAVPAR